MSKSAGFSARFSGRVRTPQCNHCKSFGVKVQPPNNEKYIEKIRSIVAGLRFSNLRGMVACLRLANLRPTNLRTVNLKSVNLRSAKKINRKNKIKIFIGSIFLFPSLFFSSLTLSLGSDNFLEAPPEEQQGTVNPTPSSTPSGKTGQPRNE